MSKVMNVFPTMVDNESFVVDVNDDNAPENLNHHTREPEQDVNKCTSVSNDNGRRLSEQTNSVFDPLMLANKSEKQSTTMVDNESFVITAHNNNAPDVSNHHTQEFEQHVNKCVSVSNGNDRTFSDQKLLLLVHRCLQMSLKHDPHDHDG